MFGSITLCLIFQTKWHFVLKIDENVVVDMEKCANLKRMPQIIVVNNLSKSNTSLPQVTLVKALDLDGTEGLPIILIT